MFKEVGQLKQETVNLLAAAHWKLPTRAAVVTQLD
jgi:hypothetical protein